VTAGPSPRSSGSSGVGPRADDCSEDGGTNPATAALALLPVAPGLASGLGGPRGGILWKILTYFAGASLFVFGSGLADRAVLYGGVVRQSTGSQSGVHRCRGRFHDHTGACGNHGRVHAATSWRDSRVRSSPRLGSPARVSHHRALGSHFHRVLRTDQVKAFVDGVTAAVTGASPGRRDPRAAASRRANDLIALVTLALLLVPKKIPETSVDSCRGIVGSC